MLDGNPGVAGVCHKTTTEKGLGRVEERHYRLCEIPESTKHLTSAWADPKCNSQVVNQTESSRGNQSHLRKYVTGLVKADTLKRSLRQKR